MSRVGLFFGPTCEALDIHLVERIIGRDGVNAALHPGSRSHGGKPWSGQLTSTFGLIWI
jgi:hypothetical protein